MLSRVLFHPAHSARRLHAAAAHYSAGAKSTSHTTNSYSKDVDSTAADPKVPRVDPSSEMVQKPHEPPSGPFSATGVEAGLKTRRGSVRRTPARRPRVGTINEDRMDGMNVKEVRHAPRRFCTLSANVLILSLRSCLLSLSAHKAGSEHASYSLLRSAACHLSPRRSCSLRFLASLLMSH